MNELVAVIVIIYFIGNIPMTTSMHTKNRTLVVFTSSTKFEQQNNESLENNKYDHRFHYIADDNGKIDIIDDEASVDTKLILRYLAEPRNTAYHLFTRYNPDLPQFLVDDNRRSIIYSNFGSGKVTVILVHGWNGYAGNEMNNLLKKAFLEDADVNVIVFDWGELARGTDYKTAKAGTAALGRCLGTFIEFLVTNRFAKYNRIHLVGFSLGAHLIGNAGRATGGVIARITALDPAGPTWYGDEERLVPTDAKYVEVIHTNTDLFGMWPGWGLGYLYPCGDVDFYPNGGGTMTGCRSTNICSHSSAYAYMASSITNKHLFGRECGNLHDVVNNNCTGSIYPMGNSDIKKRGLFRVGTHTMLSASAWSQIAKKSN